MHKNMTFKGWEYLLSNHLAMMDGIAEEVQDRTFIKVSFNSKETEAPLIPSILTCQKA